MNAIFRLLLLLSLAGLASGDDDAKWTTLFDGKSLNGWIATSEANWRVEDGAIVVDKGARGLLLHKDTNYQNYELELDFKAAKGTNSGVFLNTLERPKSVTADCYELNIAPPDNPFPTGSLVGRKRVEGAGESDQWRTFRARVENGTVTVHLDGTKILEYIAKPPSTGHRLGLQLNEGRVSFRGIRVHRLPS